MKRETDTTLELLKTLKSLMPPDGNERWIGYLVRAQASGLITADERSVILGTLLHSGIATGIAHIK